MGRMTISVSASAAVLVLVLLCAQISVSAGEILTPKPPATPRINGPAVFGVRPNHPFIYRIPATGQRPMEFSVENLPKGLSIDPQTGQITGVLPTPGEFVVTLHAKNSLASAQKKFKII